VTIGLPFPRGLVRDASQLSLRHPDGHAVPLQTSALQDWSDGSLQWGLLDFQADVPAHVTMTYHVIVSDVPRAQPPTESVVVYEDVAAFHVDTGAAQFTVEKHSFCPLGRAVVDGADVLEAEQSWWVDERGRKCDPVIREVSVETWGDLRTTFLVEGDLFGDGKRTFCTFFARLSFFAQSRIVRCVITLRNPRRAQHPDNFWDLGDAGSVFIKDFSLRLKVRDDGAPRVVWSSELRQPFKETPSLTFEIYQDSSGGERWDSPNHVNRHNKVMNAFCGYRVRHRDVETQGKRANPLVALWSGSRGVAGVVRHFWQNFPKAIEVNGRTLSLRLFPQQYGDAHELQGGEQKTHTIYLSFLGLDDDLSHINWTRAPLIPHASPEWYATTQAVPYLTPKSADRNEDYLRLVDAAIEGDDTFAHKREAIDEYGWRHFGDLYADHEAADFKGEPPLVSHYNNQYDAINGAFIQFLRSGDARWFEMMDELAAHVVDVDVYHVTEDKAAYNHGLFWHTNHHVSAATSTHRCFSVHTSPFGGGPANEHCYSTGLMHHYFLTGNVASKQTAVELAEWMMNSDDGRQNALRWLDVGDTGLASRTASRDYHGPGRGSGNAINTLLNGTLLTQDKRFLLKAEQLIRRCIHPHDDVDSRDLLDAERRWSYTVFLQALGRYLDLKMERGPLDETYAHAQQSLLHYARWMAEREYPYLEKSETLEYPNETWSAQDMRKSDVFKFAAKHARGSERERFLERSDFFFRSSVEGLLAAQTRTFTRPVVLMMTNGFMHAYFQERPDESALFGNSATDFGDPEPFVSQRRRAEAKLKRIGAMTACLVVASAAGWWLVAVVNG
jgi:hypothetical protein